MKNLLHLFVLTNLLIWMPAWLFGQCQPIAAECSMANSINVFPYQGTLLASNGNTLPFPGCETSLFIHNPSWFKLEVTSDSLEIQITPQNCNNSAGMQAALYTDCSSTMVLDTQCTCILTPFILKAYNLTPGPYYLLLDGCTGDICDFELELLKGSISPNPNNVLTPFTDTITASQSDFCPGEVDVFTIEENPAVVEYLWAFPPGYTPISINCNEATVIIGSNPGMITANVSNGQSTVEAVSFFVDIPTYTSFEYGEYCFPDEPGWLHPATFTYLPGGVWDIPMTTARGCDSIVTVEVTEITTAITVENILLCSGESVLIGGQVINVPGTYTISLSGSQGCDSTIIAIVEASLPPSMSFTITEDYCGLCEGQIDIEVRGGSPPFTYQWSNGDSTLSLTNICSGSTYEITVTDVLGCTYMNSVQLISTGSLDLQVLAEEQALHCHGACSGQIELLINCGIPPYQIDWSGTLPDGETLVTDLCEGTYSVEVSDAGGDTIVQTFNIIAPAELQVTGTTTDVNCNGTPDGMIDLEVQGGVSPYSYSWSNSLSSPNLTNLSPGNYHVIVADANGCTVAENYTVTSPQVLLVEIQASDVSCLGLGEARATPFGGTAPYVYNWNHGPSSMNVFNLPEGIYSLTITDANGCTASNFIRIMTSTELILDSTPADCDSTGGTASVTLIGGTNNPSYAWSNGGSGATQIDLAPGWYSVTVTDGNNGCTVHRNVKVPLDTACYVRISGYVYNDDINRDCIIDITSAEESSMLIELDNGGRTFTNQQGYYEFRVLPGTYDASIILNTPAFDVLCDATLSVNAPAFGTTYPDNNFYLKVNQVQDLKLKISKRNARPGFTQEVRICVMNRGTVPMDGTLTFVHDPIQTYSNTPTIPFSNYDPVIQTMTWDFTNHLPGRTIVYKVNFLIPVGTPLGEPLNMYFKVDPISGDLFPDDNEVNCSMLVTGSYDPNDKQVQPEGFGDDGGISMQDSLLSYQIRFQNTGTDTAFTVVLRDTLDDNLDPTSVVPGPSSHPYELTFLKGNILEFTFNDIMLPDSFINEPASNGFVFFDIKVKRGLEYGDMMKNTAAIYFDFNPPVITNTVTNTLRRPVGVFELNELPIELKATPNPTTGEVALEFELSEALDLRMTIHDLQGQLLQEIGGFYPYKIGKHRAEIDLSNMPQGIYLINLQAKEGRASSIRIVKDRLNF